VFSLDSVITAVGMAQNLTIMAMAIVIAVGVMLIAAGAISDFGEPSPDDQGPSSVVSAADRHRSAADGLHFHIPKGYIYFAMTFSLAVEMLNLRVRPKAA